MEKFKRYLSNLIGWQTDRKILVIESDDWGSLRMSSLVKFNKLKNAGVPLDSGDTSRYNKFDNLENEDDLNALFDKLIKFKDRNGNNLAFTPINLVANPDFEKIKISNYYTYFYEPFTQTLSNEQSNNNTIQLYHEGIKEGFFVPQFHGREHLNVAVWLKDLQSGNLNALLAFNENFWGFDNQQKHGINYQAAFDLDNPNEINYQHEIIIDGLNLFESIFKYKACYFVPPNGPFNNQLEKTAAEYGIKYISSSKIQNEALGNGKNYKRFHYLGQKNKNNQMYITRNCFFEPSQLGIDWVNNCLKEIEIAFYCKKPAVISSHRVNYIGSLNQENRINSLNLLGKLIEKVQSKWPNVEFMTSEKLGELITSTKNI